MSMTEPSLTDPRLRSGRDLLASGKALSRDWRLGPCPFLSEQAVASEAVYKRRVAATGRVMQHAHIGFRNVDRTIWAIGEVHGNCASRGVMVDRFGITLDWSMGYPEAMRAKATRGTGIVLSGPEDFARITHAAPAAAHFGDFMLGLPGAVENTCAALAAGVSSFGNLGQYFTFRLPYWDDDVATTEATVTALGLLAAQDAEILAHSNLDDGFAGLFLDMASALGIDQALLFSSVHVHSHAVVEDSVILPKVDIGEDVRLRRVVVDKHCRIPAGTQIGFDPAQDARRFHVTARGVTLVTPEMLGQRIHQIR